MFVGAIELSCKWKVESYGLVLLRGYPKTAADCRCGAAMVRRELEVRER